MTTVLAEPAYGLVEPGITRARSHWRYGHSTSGAAKPWVHLVGTVDLSWYDHTGPVPAWSVYWKCGRTTSRPLLHPQVPVESIPCPDCFGLRAPVERLSVVYYAKSSSGRIKIGTSVNVSARFSALGAELLVVEPGDRLLEGFRHSQFRELLVEGEWFDAGAALVDHIDHLRAVGE